VPRSPEGIPRRAARVAALVPPAALAMAGAGPLRGWLESVMGGAQQKLDALLGATQQAAFFDDDPTVRAPESRSKALRGPVLGFRSSSSGISQQRRRPQLLKNPR
jgi:hypothetical protein